MTIKQRLFETMDVMYQSQIMSTTFYQFLMLIEFIQMMYYSLIQKYLFKTDYFTYFVAAASYFQPLHFLRSVDQSIFSIFVIFSLAYILTAFVLLILMLLNTKSLFTLYATRIYNLLMVCLVTVFIIPFITIFVASLTCTSSLDCNSALQYVLLALSIIGILLLLLMTFYFELFLVDYNPFTPIAYASKYPKLNWIELGFKLYLSIFLVFDKDQEAQLPFISILCMMYLFLITLRLKTKQFINKKINLLKLCQSSLLFWVSLVSVIHGYLDEGEVDDIGFFYMVICSPMVVYCCIKLNRSSELNMHIKKDIELEEMIQELIQLIENRDKTANSVKLEGFVKLHTKDCMKSANQCPCTLLHLDNLRGDDQTRGQIWYQFLQALIQNSSDRLQTTRIQIIRSYILQKKLKNKFKAHYELSMAGKNRISFQDEFCIFRLQTQIEAEMIDNDKNQEIDVQQIVNFQNFYIHFEAAIEKSVNLHLEYWRELQEENPDVGKLQQLGSFITLSIDDSENLYERLLRINNNHLKTLEIFGNFLMHVVNNDIEGTRILDRAEQIARNLELNRIIDSEKFKYDQNSDTCIITCSVNIDNLGSITNCNNEITKLLGYRKQDLMRSNISRIMPKLLASVHDDFIRNFIQTSQSKVLGIERQVFAQNKKGFLISCSLMIRVLPNLRNGLQIVGFLKKSDSGDQYCYIMYDELAHSVLGFSESMNSLYGVPITVAQGLVDLQIDEIAPELIILASEAKGNVFQFNLDTTALENNYQVVQEESVEEIQQEDQSHFYGGQGFEFNQLLDVSRGNYQKQASEKLQAGTVIELQQQQFQQQEQQQQQQQQQQVIVNNQRFKKAIVRGQVVEDQEYANAKIKTIQFTENITEFNYKTMIENKSREQEDLDQKEIVDNNNLIQSEISAQSGMSMNDDNRMIKEFKVLMGERTESKNISKLNLIMFLMILILITLASLQLGYRIQQNNELGLGTEAITSAYQRTSVMADVIFYTRYLDLMAQNISTYDEIYREKLSQQVDFLKDFQYALIKYRIDMEGKMAFAIDNRVNVQFQLDNSIQNYSSSLSDAIFQLITSASIIRNASLDSFVNNSSSENTIKNVYFILTNGYSALRIGSEQVSQSYYQFQIELISNYKVTFYLILSFAIMCLIASQIFLIPIVVKIHNINNKVMSLFGLLTQKDIKELADQCDQFRNTYLLQMELKTDTQPKLYQQQQQQQLPKIKDQVIMEINNEQNDQALPSSILPTPTPNDNQQSLKAQNQNEFDAIRQSKLLNSKSSNTFSITLKFISMMMLFMTYFIVNISLEQDLINQSQQFYDHLRYTSIRPSDLKFSFYFTVEQIMGEKSTLKDEFITKLYENERLVLQSLQLGYPSQFTSYIDMYNQFNLQSMCLQNFKTKYFTLDSNDCSKLSNGILDKGLRNALTTLTLWASNIKNETTSMLDSNLFKSYIQQLYYIDQSMLHLNSLFYDSMVEFVAYSTSLENIKYSVIIIALFFVLIIIWRPYVKELSRQIWRTKGMLNMIPFEMIKQQDALKNAFLRGNIITAVK